MNTFLNIYTVYKELTIINVDLCCYRGLKIVWIAGFKLNTVLHISGWLSPVPWVRVHTVLIQNESSSLQCRFKLSPVRADSDGVQLRTALIQTESSSVQCLVNLSTVLLYVQCTAMIQSEPSPVQRWVNLSPVPYSAESSLLYILL